MSCTGMTIEAKARRTIALLLLPLIACLAGFNTYAQHADLPSLDLTQWADGAELRTIPVNKRFTSAGEIDPFPDEQDVIGLGITGYVQLNGSNSLVRVILVDDELNEYLAYEAYPLIFPNVSFPISNACRETCMLPPGTPSTLKIEVINAAINIQSIAVNPATQMQASMTAMPASKLAGVNEVKQAQESEIIELLNGQIASLGLRWVAGETSISKLPYAEKKALFGRDTLPNLQGFDYYTKGIFDIRDGSDPVIVPSAQSAFVESFDWRSRHGANNPASPYFDGDETGSGWITSVKRQKCADCWAYSAVGTVEAQANIYFNQHVDLDLSEQQMVSCSGAGSCSGGNPGGVLAHIVNVGAVDEACFPSSGTDEPCANMCPVPDETIMITGYHSVSRDSEDTLKGSIIEHGPIAFGISSWWHCMVAVGYQRDTSDGGTIWILKNSWGDGWGESGYGYIKVPLNDVYLTYAIDGPVSSLLKTREVACYDKDGDGYFNWGISLTKPASCPGSAPDVNDCNDADPGVAQQGEDGSCTVLEVQPALYDRGNGLIYDAVLDITWLQDGKFSRTRFIESGGTDGFANGEATWDNAIAWTEGLVHLGYDDWRLPSLKNWSSPLSNDPSLAEMGYMFINNLNRSDSICDGGVGGVVSDCQASFIDAGTGDVVSFFNMEPFLYWYAEEEADSPGGAYLADFNYGGGVGSTGKDTELYFWPVRDGDVKSTATIEAESMALSGGYAVEANAAASGGQLIRRLDSGGQPATASTQYTGPAGNYDIAVSYFDESDGMSSLAFLLNGQMLDQWVADEDPACGDCASPGENTLRTRLVASGMRLSPGDELTLQGTGEHYEYARFDKITVAPVSSSKFEAEKMSLKGGYAVEDNAAASGGQLIRRLDSGGYPATASTQYPGPAGTYDIAVSYFDENDGMSSLAFLLNGQMLDQWIADQDPVCSDCASPGANTLRTRVVARGVGLSSGDELTLQGTGEHYEYARFDKVTVSPVDTQKPVAMYSYAVDGDGLLIDPLPLDGAQLERKTGYFTFTGNYERVNFWCCKVPDGEEAHGEKVEDLVAPFVLRVDLGALPADSGLPRELYADLFTSATEYSGHTAYWYLEEHSTDTVTFDDDATHTIDYTIPGAVEIDGSTTVNLVDGAKLLSDLQTTYDNESNLNIYGGEVYGRTILIWVNQTHIYDGRFIGGIINDSADLTIHGGWMPSVRGGGYVGNIIIHGGILDELTVHMQSTEIHGGTIGEATFWYFPLLVSGGIFTGPVVVVESWECEITGGEFQKGLTISIEPRYSSGCAIKGGQFGEAFVYADQVDDANSAKLVFYGDLQLSEPVKVSENQYQSRITGMLADGSFLSQTITCYAKGLHPEFVGTFCDLVEIVRD